MIASRTSRRQLLELRQRLPERDLALVAQVAELRLMSGRQLQAVHFPNELHATEEAASRVCRRTLQRLVSLGVLMRLERRIGGLRAGSASFVYALGPLGHRLLEKRQSARPRRYEPSAAFATHQLAVSQLAVDLILASRRRRCEVLVVEGEPACWRTLTGLGRIVLRPDLFLSVGVDELEYRWFVELDRGTHHRPALLRKAQLYESYYQTGVEQATHGVFPRVLWIAPDPTRASQLRSTLDRGGFTDNLLMVTTSEDAVAVLTGARA